MADRASEALARVPAERRAAAHMVFTAHSVPVAMAAGSPYASQLEAAGSRIAARLGRRSGRSPTRAGAGRPASPGSSPTSAIACARCEPPACGTSWSSPWGSCPTTWRCSTTSTSRRAGSANELGLGLSAGARRQRPPAIRRAPRRSRGRRAGRAMKLVVVGGGIAGLAAAHRAVEWSREHGAPLDLTLFEAGDRLGGTIQSERRDGFLVECGRRLVPLREAVGPGAVPATRSRGPARRDRRPLSPHVRGLERPAPSAPRGLSAPGADALRAVRPVAAPVVAGQAQDGTRPRSSRAAATPTRAWAPSSAAASAARRSPASRNRWSPASTRPIPTSCRWPPPCRASSRWSAASEA